MVVDIKIAKVYDGKHWKVIADIDVETRTHKTKISIQNDSGWTTLFEGTLEEGIKWIKDMFELLKLTGFKMS